MVFIDMRKSQEVVMSLLGLWEGREKGEIL
jgi:hypothetical protein